MKRMKIIWHGSQLHGHTAKEGRFRKKIKGIQSVKDYSSILDSGQYPPPKKKIEKKKYEWLFLS